MSGFNNIFEEFFKKEKKEVKPLDFQQLIEKFEKTGELDITELYKNFKDLTLVMLVVVSKFKDDIKIEVDNNIKEDIEGFRQLFLNKVIIKRKETR